MANMFMFQRNQPNANNLPQWLQTVDAKIANVTRELNSCQDGVRDIAARLGSDADVQNKVADLAARITVGRNLHQRLHDDLKTKLDMMKRADQTAQDLQSADPQYLDNWATTVAPVAKRLLPTYLALFGDMNLIRDISDEHKVLLFNKELEHLQRRYDALEAQLNVPVVPDAREFVPTQQLEEARTKLEEAEKSLEQEQALRRKEASAASDRISHLEEEADVQRAMLGTLKTDLADAKRSYESERDAARAEHRNELGKQQEEQERLQETVSRCQSDLTTMTRDRDDLQVELTALQNRNQDLADAQSQIGHDRDDVQDDLDKAELKLEEYRVRQRSHDETIRIRDGKIKELEAQLDDSRKQADAESQASKKWEAMYETVSDTLEKANIELGTCRTQAQDATTLNAGLKFTNNALSARYNELEASATKEIRSLQEERSSLREQQNILNVEYDMLDASRSAVYNRVIELESDVFGRNVVIEEQREQIRRLSTSHRYSLTMLTDAEQTIRALRANLSTLTMQHSNLQIRSEALEANVSTLTRQNSNLRIRSEALEARAGTIKTALNQCNDFLPTFVADVCDVPNLGPSHLYNLLQQLKLDDPVYPTSDEIPPTWTVQQPWGPHHGNPRQYPFSAGLGATNLAVRLYDRISQRLLTRGSFLLVKLLMQELTKEAPTAVYTQLMNMVLGLTISVVPTVPNDLDTQLFCFGIIQLLSLVKLVRNSGGPDRIWHHITDNNADQVRQLCLDVGVHHGNHSLVDMDSDNRVLMIDHAAQTLRLIDDDILVLENDLHGRVKAPPGNDDITMPIDGPQALAWWLQCSGEVKTDP
ncbi:hypothetical protein PG996_004855 [Apiospora saccharicola]|uniref:Uncharacterized protein n=1 Tax=Apiospora saccharicola TaxID=335842 RepID=A0ABR1VJU8_9PEZI